MSDIGTEAFGACYAALPEARATATFGSASVARCLLAGVGSRRNPTELGAGVEYDIVLTILSTDEPSRGTGFGDVVRVTAYRQTRPVAYRIVGRQDMGGSIAFSLEFQHGQ